MMYLGVMAFANSPWEKPIAISAISTYKSEKESELQIADMFFGFRGRGSLTDYKKRADAEELFGEIQKTHKSYKELLQDFSNFLAGHYHDSVVVVSEGVPLESSLLAEAAPSYIKTAHPIPFFDVGFGVLRDSEGLYVSSGPYLSERPRALSLYKKLLVDNEILANSLSAINLSNIVCADSSLFDRDVI